MRTGVVLVLLGMLWAAACTSTNIIDEDCIMNGGICFTKEDPNGCDHALDFGCSAGYECCMAAYAANYSNGTVIPDAATGQPDVAVDSAFDVTGFLAPDGGTDAPTVDGATTDAPLTDGTTADAPVVDAPKG